MPIYEYKCGKCGHSFELRRGFNDTDDNLKCHQCGVKKPRRLLSMFGTAGAGDSCASSGPGITGGG